MKHDEIERINDNHYADDPEHRSVPDALRAATRDVLDD